MICYLQYEYYVPSSYIITSTGNRICRTSIISKPQSLEIPGGRVIIKSNCKINCENAPIIINKYSLIDDKVNLNPSSTLFSLNQPIKYIPLTIGSHCYIGKNCIIESAVIGSSCYIEENCILSPRTILKDFVYVESSSFITSDTVIPPFSIISGNPAKVIGELPESVTTYGFQNAVLRYKNFKPKIE
jgi:dynactin-5